MIYFIQRLKTKIWVIFLFMSAWIFNAWLPITSGNYTTLAQSIDPINDSVVSHLHPITNTIGMTNGVVFETYTLNYVFQNQLILLNDPSLKPRQRDFVWSPDGSKLAVLISGLPVPSTTTIVQIWDMTTSQKLYELPSIDGFASIAWKPDSTRFAALIATAPYERVVRVHDTQTGQAIVDIPAGMISQLAWNPQGNQIVFEGVGRILVWDANTGQQVSILNARISSDVKLAFSPTDNLIAFSNVDSPLEVIDIWDIDTGQLVQQLQLQARIIDLNWSAGGLVTTSFDSMIRVWDVQTGEMIHTIQAGLYPKAELSADGTYLLVEDETTGNHVREATTGAILAVFATNCDTVITC